MHQPSRVLPFNNHWLYRREIGSKTPFGTKNALYTQIYSNYSGESFDACDVRGGIYSLEFSPSGSLLAAACERKCVDLFDPFRRKLIKRIENAHENCVNSIKFIDSNLFATCSDDKKVALWDCRNLNTRLRLLHGHTSWVKNIEYHDDEQLIVTSGFDGNIFSFVKNDPGPNSYGTNLFFMNGLMRSRLTPDASKLIISNTAGYLMVIHNLNLLALRQDLKMFKPNAYRLMQLCNEELPTTTEFTPMFRQKGGRNRLEFITDFPEGNLSEVISSLQVHPAGHSVVSRNVSEDEESEWTCIHNIEERMSSDEEDSSDEANDLQAGNVEDEDDELSNVPSSAYVSVKPSTVLGLFERAPTANSIYLSPTAVWEAATAYILAKNQRRIEANTPPTRLRDMLRVPTRRSSAQPRRRGSADLPPTGGSSGSSAPERNPAGNGSTENQDRRRNRRQVLEPRVDFRMNDENYPLQTYFEQNETERRRRENGCLIRRRKALLRGYRINRLSGELRNTIVPQTVAAMMVEEDESPSDEDVSSIPLINNKKKYRKNPKIYRNIPRLTHYIEESNTGRGFIKEVCFSPDGRILCSPYGNAIRLLAFSPGVEDLYYCYPRSPQQLYEVNLIANHSAGVVSTKFSPHQNLLVSGSLRGDIQTYQPRF